MENARTSHFHHARREGGAEQNAEAGDPHCRAEACNAAAEG